MSEKCRWLHESLEVLPIIRYPFETNNLPQNGIYFFYEDGEIWGHGENNKRIVRIGTHKGNNFRNRISEHYLFEQRKMNFDKTKSKPADRSIFRKNIGRAILNRDGDPYLEVWEIDYLTRATREQLGELRDIPKEKMVEREITRIIRETLSIRFLIIESEDKRIGKKGLESNLIGTVNQCSYCSPSSDWLGRYSPKEKIRVSGLWQEQHLYNEPIGIMDMNAIDLAIQRTLDWCSMS